MFRWFNPRPEVPGVGRPHQILTYQLIIHSPEQFTTAALRISRDFIAKEKFSKR